MRSHRPFSGGDAHEPQRAALCQRPERLSSGLSFTWRGVLKHPRSTAFVPSKVSTSAIFINNNNKFQCISASHRALCFPRLVSLTLTAPLQGRYSPPTLSLPRLRIFGCGHIAGKLRPLGSQSHTPDPYTPLPPSLEVLWCTPSRLYLAPRMTVRE